MVTNIYPLFERNRIMKKEMLWAIRDHAYHFGELLFKDYANGVLCGCEISVSGDELIVGGGILKYGGFLYLLDEAQRIPYTHHEEYLSLKTRFSRTEERADYIRYDAAILLDDNLSLAENELELCRFKLKKGFRLRRDYVSFEDIQTEFDTVNLADATHAAQGGPGLSPYITTRFAHEALTCRMSDPWDITFCSHCLQSALAVSPAFLKGYVMGKLEVDDQAYSNRQLFDYLVMILRNLQNGTDLKPSRGSRKKREILVN